MHTYHSSSYIHLQWTEIRFALDESGHRTFKRKYELREVMFESDQISFFLLIALLEHFLQMIEDMYLGTQRC